MNIEISLIISTYGRYEELDLLLKSLSEQEFDLKAFEVIIVDQNEILDLQSLVEKYKEVLTMNYCKVTFKGLSKAKNKGIELARGRILTFPDDDCTFYADTISNAIGYLQENPAVDVVYGKVFDRQTKRNIMRNWSNTQLELNLLNFSLNYSAITCFTKSRMKFDENYGVGSAIASGEELDYIIRAINEGLIVKYTPAIEVWHPELNINTMPVGKIYNYAYGYAAILRKNINLTIFLIFICSLGYQLVRLLFSILSKDFIKYKMAVKGRIKGFLKY